MTSCINFIQKTQFIFIFTNRWCCKIFLSCQLTHLLYSTYSDAYQGISTAYEKTVKLNATFIAVDDDENMFAKQITFYLTDTLSKKKSFMLILFIV